MSTVLSGTLVFRGPSTSGPRKVALILYGPGKYANYILDNTTANFYREIMNSTWIDWLSEYDVPAANYSIKRGSFIGTFQINITHGTVINGVTVTDRAKTHNDWKQAVDSGAIP